jgi:hypothetical protein
VPESHCSNAIAVANTTANAQIVQINTLLPLTSPPHRDPYSARMSQASERDEQDRGNLDLLTYKTAKSFIHYLGLNFFTGSIYLTGLVDKDFFGELNVFAV